MKSRPIRDYFGIVLALVVMAHYENSMEPSVQDGQDVIERSRLLCAEAKQLCSDLQEALASMQQLVWQFRELSRSGNLAVGRLAGKTAIFSGTNVKAGILLS